MEGVVPLTDEEAQQLKKHLRNLDWDKLVQEEGGMMGSTQTGWMEGEMVVDWPALDKAIDEFAAWIKQQNRK